MLAKGCIASKRLRTTDLEKCTCFRIFEECVPDYRTEPIPRIRVEENILEFVALVYPFKFSGVSKESTEQHCVNKNT